jgi:hypothetical protein
MPSSGMLHCVLRLLVTANVLPSLPILVTLMMEVIHSSEMSVLNKSHMAYIPEKGILHNYLELVYFHCDRISHSV